MWHICHQPLLSEFVVGIVRLKPDGTRWRTGGKLKGKLANGVGSQYSDTTSERGVSSITTADAHTSAASSRLNWRPRRFKWTRPIRRKTKSGFCACAITFQTHYTCRSPMSHSMPQQLVVCQGILIVEATRTHADTPRSVGLPWTRDQSDAEAVPDNTRKR